MTSQDKILRKFSYEFQLCEQGLRCIAGVDEVGRGPLAGPVVAAALVFPAEWIRSGFPRELMKINDSKQLSEPLREELFEEIRSRPEIKFSVASVTVQMIDQINILQATHLAMAQALAGLSTVPDHVLVDGLRVKSLPHPQTPIVKGDALSYSIAGASIMAKVTRDRMMKEIDESYPMYGFASHKGYGTPEHLAAIKLHGACPVHRLTFAPFRPVQAELFLGV